MGGWQWIDVWVFQRINSQWVHPALEAFFPFWTDIQKTPLFCYVLLPFILGFTYWRARRKGCIDVALAALAVSFSDLFIGRAVKLWFPRERPEYSHLPFEVLVRGSSVGGSSFPSSHAADAFCLAAFLGHFYPRLRAPLFCLASLTAYSRIYCGFHYPSDVVAGALLGSGLGWGFAVLFAPLRRRFGAKGVGTKVRNEVGPE
jgi:undecaprenyl-diphosphatase